VRKLHRRAKRGASLEVSVVDASPGLQQGMHGAVVPVLGGRAERGDAPGVGVLNHQGYCCRCTEPLCCPEAGGSTACCTLLTIMK
jgi:hypothetical protein